MDFPFAWALGTPDQRQLGGIVAQLWADSVLPYTLPDPLPSDPPEDPTWWNQPAPQRGQFEGWVRNFSADEDAGWPNFPNDGSSDPVEQRFFNCVIPIMLGLKISDSAPRRMVHYGAELYKGIRRNASDGPSADERWPFRAADNLAIRFIEYYLKTFVDAGTTAIIIALPVREVMNFIGNSLDPNLYPVPDQEAGQEALEAFVNAVLTKAKELGITILGWYLIDEPDLIESNFWTSPEGIAGLRLEIRRLEYAWRMADVGMEPNDSAFQSLPMTPQGEVERQALLRPCLTTLTKFFTDGPPEFGFPAGYISRTQPRDYVEAGAADLYLFDWYPFRRTRQEVESDWLPCPGSPQKDFSILERFEAFSTGANPMTPKKSILRFRAMRRALNPSADPDNKDVLPGTPGYIPVLLWGQGDGAPFHEPTITEGTAALAPSALPRPNQTGGEGCGASEPTFRRLKSLPSADEVRFYMWAGLFDLSEGFSVFHQTLLADNSIVTNFVPVARELAYFQSLRFQGINKTGLYVPNKAPNFFRHLKQGQLPEGEIPLAPVFWWAAFPPTYEPGPLIDLPTVRPREWLIIINRESTTLTADFEVDRGHFPSGEWVLHEVKFLNRLDNIITIGSGDTKPHVSIPVEPFRMRMFYQRRRKPTDPPVPGG